MDQVHVVRHIVLVEGRTQRSVATRLEALLAESVRWTGGKQRLTATRLHGLLRAEGHQVGVTLVKQAVAE